ncbi:hypothetical protein EW145_g5048 [Phellinidium pouzarii]|uniref:Uncharacterized protein n=1 Tax=Phellinidium pouzarii TaxID=167371 RepID=A0A4S4L2S7_9AGAM|nr:hypothetical protein EW145_g5048 [Phellinidium pouzarii]
MAIEFDEEISEMLAANRERERKMNIEDRTIRSPMVHPTQNFAARVRDMREGTSNKNVNLKWFFAMLSRMTMCLERMHLDLKQVHGDVNPMHMLWYTKRSGKTFFMLNDWDSGYTGRLGVEAQSVQSDELGDPYSESEYDKARDYLRTTPKLPGVKAIGGTRMHAILAPWIRSIGDAFTPVPDTDHSWKAIVDCASAVHRLFNVCHILHGDISLQTVCWSTRNDGTVIGVLTDIDDYDPEEIRFREQEWRKKDAARLGLDLGLD